MAAVMSNKSVMTLREAERQSGRQNYSNESDGQQQVRSVARGSPRRVLVTHLHRCQCEHNIREMIREVNEKDNGFAQNRMNDNQIQMETER